jgi:hypothetical protein
MRGAMRAWITFLLVVLAAGAARAQVVSVPFPDSMLPTQTFLWPAKDARAVLVMIPGGDGRIGLVPSRTDLGGFYGRTFKPLSDPTQTSGKTNVVIFDSPNPLQVSRSYLASRATAEHLGRIESVVRFYSEKFGKPVWLQGHSNGAISVAEFLRSREKLISGAIFSSSREGVKVASDTKVPVLFLHHRKETCSVADGKDDVRSFEALKAAGKTNTAFVWIEGGSADAGNPCASGYHLYAGAELEAARAIDAFMGSN